MNVCMMKLETIKDLYPGNVATAIDLSIDVDALARAEGGIPHLISVGVRFLVAAAGAQTAYQGKVRLSRLPVLTGITNVGDWEMDLDVEDRTAAASSNDYLYEPFAPYPWPESAKLRIRLSNDNVAGLLKACIVTVWGFSKGR